MGTSCPEGKGWTYHINHKCLCYNNYIQHFCWRQIAYQVIGVSLSEHQTWWHSVGLWSNSYNFCMLGKFMFRTWRSPTLLLLSRAVRLSHARKFMFRTWRSPTLLLLSHSLYNLYEFYVPNTKLEGPSLITRHEINSSVSHCCLCVSGPAPPPITVLCDSVIKMWYWALCRITLKI